MSETNRGVWRRADRAEGSASRRTAGGNTSVQRAGAAGRRAGVGCGQMLSSGLERSGCLVLVAANISNGSEEAEMLPSVQSWLTSCPASGSSC